MASNTDYLILKTRTSQELLASFANAFAERGFVLPETASMKKGPVVTDPSISKAPYLAERNLCYGDCTI